MDIKKVLCSNEKIYNELNCNSNKTPKAAVCVFYEVIVFDGTEVATWHYLLCRFFSIASFGLTVDAKERHTN